MLRKLMYGAALLVPTILSPAAAQITTGHGTIVTLPVVVQSGTYSSAIFIHNPNNAAVPIDSYYIGADGSASPGRTNCATINVPANTTLQRSLTQLCMLNAGSNFGRLTMLEADVANRPFSLYSRVESFSGNGFSIEGIPIGNLTGSVGASWVNGLRRQAAAPTYQTNCFIGALNEAVTVNWRLETSTGTQLGTTQSASIGQNQMIRLLDVFTVAGAPAGDHSNVRARFFQSGAGEPGFVAYCTLQNSTSFDADFRIAKDDSPADQGQSFTAIGRDGLTFSPNLTLTSGDDDVFLAFWKHPDRARCFIGGPNPSNLELRVKNPAGVVVGGGTDFDDTGEFALGERSTVNGGVNGAWRIEVGSALGSTVETYTLTCTTGNGGSDPIRVGTQPDGF